MSNPTPQRVASSNGSADMDAADRRILSRLLDRGLGLTSSPTLLAALAKQCRLRAASLDKSPEAYLRLLHANGSDAKAEWILIAPAIVVGETFLYRDAALWELIETKLIPDAASTSSHVRLWSAGCSTGEEAYSLAGVAHRAVGHKHVRILGTDVNPVAIAAARVGIYGRWSMRGAEASDRNGLIVNGAQTVRVSEEVKSLVRFETHNLNDPDAWPPLGAKAFDLIICRNVLIYMSESARTDVIARFVTALHPRGLLVLGHGEMAGLRIHNLSVECYDAGIVFRKVENVSQEQSAASASKQSKSAINRIVPKQVAVTKRVFRGFIPTPPPGAALAPRPKLAAEREMLSPAICRRHVASAIQSAREGKLQAAERDATAAAAADALDPEPRVLLAALCMVRGAWVEAEGQLRGALFLDPCFVPALWQMGNLCSMTGRKRQASRAFARALNGLDGIADDKVALPFDNVTVGELVSLLRAELAEPARA
ncbi:MAG: hypothetical protein GIW99_06000 [Candidatus Eremiobacteraeota bacterium]|nr:hypothetical protein [Candidatus Eremiobacteraeota bacterium]MBC5827222.1 hypothetical protein [Candidatus Eremiobacteraeota bacterium]